VSDAVTPEFDSADVSGNTDVELVREVVASLSAGRDLAANQARDAIVALVGGRIPDELMIDFLSALTEKGPNATEIQGFLSGMRLVGVAVDPGREVVDIVGTGGDGHHSVNISTMAAIALAATGVPVVKHGNRAATSLCGAADVLEALGVGLNLDANGIRQCVDEVGIAFCFAPAFHPAMRHVAAARRAFGKPTVFNVLGPLANPAQASTMLVGTPDSQRAQLVAEALIGAGVRAAVVSAQDGMDEVSTLVPTRMWLDAEQSLLDPLEFDVLAPEPGDLTGGDAAQNAAIARAVLGGVRDRRVDAVRDCVALNAALARAVWSGAIDEMPLKDAVAKELSVVRSVMLDGEAAGLLSRWAELSSSLAR
jgi:anthranilate phosphoribosyltransferase